MSPRLCRGGAEPSTAGTITIEKQFAILGKVLIFVIGRDVTSVGGEARVEKLHAEFEDGVEMVTSHGEANYQAIQLSVHKKRTERFINEVLEDWSTAVHDAGLFAKSTWHEPPGIDDLPTVVLPTWTKVGAYLDAGGLEHVDIHKDPVATREKEGVRLNARAGTQTPLSCRVLVEPSSVGDPCKYRHHPSVKFKGKARRWRRQRGGTQKGKGRGWHGAGRSCVGRQRRERQEQRRRQAVQEHRRIGVRAPPDGGANLGD